VEKKSKAQRFLERVEMIETIIENKLTEQRRWKELALSISANMDGEKIPSSSKSTSKMADAVIKCIAMEDEIAEAVDKLIAEKKKVTKVLESLYSPMEYRILHMRYIQHISLTDISEKLNKDYNTVKSLHWRGVQSVGRILGKKKEQSN
jgi:DNA-directed RNA polymerase specialized sigma24 family protein